MRLKILELNKLILIENHILNSKKRQKLRIKWLETWIFVLY